MDVRKDFNKVLEVAGLHERKDGMKRRKLTLHSFRRFTKSIISDNAGKDYREWLIGHAKSPYYTKKLPEKMEIYNTTRTKYERNKLRIFHNTSHTRRIGFTNNNLVYILSNMLRQAIWKSKWNKLLSRPYHNAYQMYYVPKLLRQLSNSNFAVRPQLADQIMSFMLM